MTPAEQMQLDYAEKQAKRRMLKLIDIRDKLQAADSTADRMHVAEFLPSEIDDFLSNEVCPGEGPTDKCPDCGEPWWTVQKRCKCWPKVGKGDKIIVTPDSKGILPMVGR